MTQNEQIAEVMGWGRCDEFSFYDWANIKQMQSKLVEDGWVVIIEQDQIEFHATGMMNHAEGETIVAADTEPAAIVALFCKVYRIENAPKS